MIVSLIAALDENNGIGADNQLLWHLPDDFKWFKQHTKGKPMVMGRNTMLSLGKPLPGRLNVVVSRSGKDIIEGFHLADSIEKAISILPKDTEEVMVIGEGVVYKHVIAIADRMYITRIHHAFEQMDTFFPEWNESEWQVTYEEHHPADERHQFAFDFLILDRIKG